MSVELTASAKKKLPAAKKAKAERKRKGSLGNVKKSQAKKKSRLDEILAVQRMNTSGR